MIIPGYCGVFMSRFLSRFLHSQNMWNFAVIVTQHCHMKRIFSLRSYLLLAVIGFFSSLSLSAQQYHDAAAFGLKGNVKECKLVDGSYSEPHYFVKQLSFSKDGKLSKWDDKVILDAVRSGGLLTSIKYETSFYNMNTTHEDRFYYRDGRLTGIYARSRGQLNNTTEVFHYWTDVKKGDIFYAEYFDSSTIIEMSSSSIEEQLKKSGDLTSFIGKNYNWDVSWKREYTIIESDSHGNYVLLTSAYFNGTKTITSSVKRIITYWDEPSGETKQTSSTSSASASKSSSTSAASYLKVDGSTTSKTVSFTSSGGRKYYSVDTSASDFETWGVPTWCSVEKSSTGFTLVCASNPSSSSRSDYMKVKADGQEIRIDISQSGSTSSYSSSSSRPSSSSRYSYGGRRTRSYSKPWITIGIDGSLDYFISDTQTQTTYYDPYYGDYYTEYTEGEDKLAFGAGLRVRIGRIDQWFNLIGGARYMFGGMKGIQVPVLLNWNLLRGDEMAMYIGGGYEFGITEMYKGLGSAMVQLGISIPHFDCSFFYKPSQSVLGLGMTVYL